MNDLSPWSETSDCSLSVDFTACGEGVIDPALVSARFAGSLQGHAVVSGYIFSREVEVRIPPMPRQENYSLEMTLCANTLASAEVSIDGIVRSVVNVVRVGTFVLPVPGNFMARPDLESVIRVKLSEASDPSKDPSVLDLLPIRHLVIRSSPKRAESRKAENDELHPRNLDDRELMLRFHSLGDNCELGIAQRHYGAEPLDLYRFSSVPLGWIIEGIDNEFADIGNPSTETQYLGTYPREDNRTYYYNYQRRYRIPFETGVEHTTRDHAQMLAETSARYKRFGQNLLEDLEDGERIFVIKRAKPYTWHEIQAIRHRLARRGSCGLLVVEEADHRHPATLVEMLAPGVMRGYVSRFSDGRSVASTTDSPSWLALCQKAYTSWWHQMHYGSCPAVLPADFDALTYLEMNSDVQGIDAVTHYATYGAYEGRLYRR